MALQYVVKTYLHTERVNYLQNISMKTKSQKKSNRRNFQQLFQQPLQQLLELRISHCIQKFPNWTQIENIKKIQIFKELDHRHSFTGIFCHKIFFLKFEQGKQPRNFDIGNAWWIINNVNCGIDVKIKSTCCNNFKQIAKIQLVRGLLVNITEFAFGTNSFIG